MRRLVILGTGTGVGKTYVSCALASALARRLAIMQALKPIETGVLATQSGDPMPGSDAALLEAVSSPDTRIRPHPRYAFERPVSPHLGARLAGARVDLPVLSEWANNASHRITSHATAFQLIETPGGACSPLNGALTNVDLARSLEPAIWILVAPDALGVLHDVRATLMALPRPPDFLFLSAARDADASTGTNASELAVVGLPSPVAVLGRDGSSLEPLVDALLG